MKFAVRSEQGMRWRHGVCRVAAIAFCTLILCSCRSPAHRQYTAGGTSPKESLPAEANTGTVRASWTEPVAEAIVDAPLDPPGMEKGVPLPYTPQNPWAPPGLSQPWPKDEFLRDGGDKGFPATVTQQAEVLGLEMEDTVAHFDTLDGQTLVQPSNEVYIYSPRFGAVRQVVGVMATSERQKATGIHEPIRLVAPESHDFVASSKQQVQLNSQASANPAVAVYSKQGDGALSGAIGLGGFQDRFKTYENLAIVRQGTFAGAETAMLARGSNAAISWSHTDSLQILLEHQNATADVKYDQSLSLYTVTSPPGTPRLRLVKVASTPFAKPGEEVDFTLRFDNVGTEPIGNITLVDNLTTRLEYVAGSAQCSVDARFSTQPNEGESLAIRCEVVNPLEPGQGGIVRFRCRVR